MKIGIASDHRGYKMKQKILKFLRNNNYEVIDYGTDSEESVDYNDYAKIICDNINDKKINYGILICSTGIGMSIAANKVNGIMCAKADNKREAVMSRRHNDANVLAISSHHWFMDVKDIVDGFLHTPFDGDERLVRRINKIKELECSKHEEVKTEKKVVKRKATTVKNKKKSE